MNVMGMRVTDWMKLNVGDLVARNDDPNHIAVVKAILNSAIVRVTWIDYGWSGDEFLRDIRRINARDYLGGENE